MDDLLDLLIVGAGPTGLSVGVEAQRAGLRVLLIDKGALTQSFLGYPTYMTFFTTRDRIEIGGMPLTIPEDKPTRQQALAYYRAVVEANKLPLALHEEVLNIVGEGEAFRVETVCNGEAKTRRARRVVVATGYFGNPNLLPVPGAALPWVQSYYLEPYPHYGESVAIIGGANSAAKYALDLWRNGARVTLIHRGPKLRETVKYWIRPDIENRIKEGSIAAHFNTTVSAFTEHPRGIEARGADGTKIFVPVSAAYVLIGYRPDIDLLKRCGVRVAEDSLIPDFNAETLESNVPGLFLAGAVIAGKHTERVFIDNSRDHGAKIVAYLRKARS